MNGKDKIPYWKHELLMYRLERRSNRLMIATIGALILLIGSNFAWIAAKL